MEIKTKILIRNDSTANWEENVKRILAKGEMGIEFTENGLAKLKIGDGSSTWNELKYLSGKVQVNDNIFKYNDETLDLDGFADALTGSHLVKTEDGIAWVQDDTSTVDNLSKTVAEIKLSLDSKAEADNVYTKEEVDKAINEAVTNVNHLKRKKVNSTDEIDLSAEDADRYIYLVPRESSENTVYDEYMVIDGKLEKIGGYDIDLTDYAKTSDVEKSLEAKVDKVENSRLITNEEAEKLAKVDVTANKNIIDVVSDEFTIDANGNKLNINSISTSKIDGLSALLDNKVSKEEGKGLSTNDFTDELRDIVLGLTTSAPISGVQVNGTDLIIKNGVVNIPVATNELLGVVKSSTAKDGITILANGEMAVNGLNVNKLYQDEGDVLVLNGGDSKSNY